MALHLVTGYSGKAHITSADQGALHAAVFGRENNVLNAGNCFAATVVTNNSIEVKDGEAIMQGRQIRMESGDFESVTIENGTQGQKRNDLICIRYTKDSNTGVEDATFVVIKGASDASAAVDPAYNTGNILDGALIVDFPLYRVPLDGLNVGELVPLFEVVDNFDERLKAIIDGIVAVGNALKLGGKTAAEWQEAIDNSFDGDADSLGGETAEEWQGKIDGKLSIDGENTASVTRNALTPFQIVSKSGKGVLLNFVGTEGNRGAIGFPFGDTASPYALLNGSYKEFLHTGNKPSGSYTGNGSATTRTVTHGGNSGVVVIRGENTSVMAIVTYKGYFGKNSNNAFTAGTDVYLSNSSSIQMSTTSALFNTNGETYKYYCL